MREKNKYVRFLKASAAVLVALVLVISPLSIGVSAAESAVSPGAISESTEKTQETTSEGSNPTEDSSEKKDLPQENPSSDAAGESSESSEETPETKTDGPSTEEISGAPAVDSTKKEETTSEDVAAEKGEEDVAEVEQQLEEFLVSTEADLRSLAEKVNGGEDMSGYRVLLQNDIKLETSPWVPIGATAITPFSGVFDGGGFQISGLQVAPDVAGGLFGYLTDATLTNVNLLRPLARKSTAGFFFAASRSTVELGSYQVSQAPAAFAFASSRAADVWAGPVSGVNKNWHGLGAGATVPVGYDYVIRTSADLAGFADSVNQGLMEYGSTVTLMNSIDLNGSQHDWTPIGDSEAASVDLLLPNEPGVFVGTFVGNGNTISNMKVDTTQDSGGLFGFVASEFDPAGGALAPETPILSTSSLSGITFVNASVSAASGTGVLVGEIYDINIFDITVYNSKVTTGFFGGGIFGDSTVTSNSLSTVKNCTVIGTSVTGDYIGGIAGNSMISIVNSVVAGGNLHSVDGGQSGGIVSGISGWNYLPASLSTNMVVGTHFSADTTDVDVAGFAALEGDATASNNIISGITTDDNIKNTIGSFYLGFETSDGAQYTFTDVTEYDLFVNNSSEFQTIMNFWDSASITMTEPLDNANGNSALSAKFLANGRWVPNALAWSASEDSTLYYPQLTSMKESDKEYVREISAFAATPLYALEETVYTDGAGVPRMVLTNKTLTGAPVTWTIRDGAGAIMNPSSYSRKPNATGTYDIFGFETGMGIAVNLTASINLGAFGTVEKTFAEFSMNDGILHEIVSERIRIGAAIRKENPISLTFSEAIEVNPNIAALAELRLYKPTDKEADADGYIVKQRIALDKESNLFTLGTGTAPGTFTATVNFGLIAGETYRVVLPEGMVVQQNTNNTSDRVILEFNTLSISDPVIRFSENKATGNNETPFAVNDVLKLLSVFENAVEYSNEQKNPGSGKKLYPKATTTAIQYTGSQWDDNDIEKSIGLIFNDPAYFTTDKEQVVYFIDRHDQLINATPTAGTYRFYVLAQNAFSAKSYDMISVSIAGTPAWSSDEPRDHVHMPLTDDINMVKSIAKQEAIATVAMEDGGSISFVPVPVQVLVDKDDWSHVQALRKNDKKTPTSLTVRLQVLDQLGQESDLSMDIVVYLDHHLAWTMTPSPVVLNYSTPGQIEKFMNVQPRNFKNTDLLYEHFANNYRTAGSYYVDLYSKDQVVTNCPQTNCDYPGVHPKKIADDYLQVEIVRPASAELDTYWGNAAAAMENETYSQEIIELEPDFYALPRFVVDSLQKQNYGKMQLSYFDEYRWNLYSTTLNTSYKWNDFYSLEINGANDSAVSALIEGTDNAIQFTFENEGTLFGEVEFEMNLAKARKANPNLATEKLALYLYNHEKGTLDLVSPMIVDQDGIWASAVIDQTVPTIYVIKGSGSPEAPVKETTKEAPASVTVGNGSYLAAKAYEGRTPTDYANFGSLVDKTSADRLFLGGADESTYVIEKSLEMPEIETESKGISLPMTVILVIIGVAALAGAFIYISSIGKENE